MKISGLSSIRRHLHIILLLVITLLLILLVLWIAHRMILHINNSPAQVGWILKSSSYENC